MQHMRPITRKFLSEEWIRTNLQWRTKNGVDQFNRVVYRSRSGTSVLICAQRPVARVDNDYQNFILWLNSVPVYTALEHTRGGPFQQVRVFLTSEDFDWHREWYPTDEQILAQGETITMHEIERRVKAAGDRLIVAGNEECFFMREDFTLVESIPGEDPDEYDMQRNGRNGNNRHQEPPRDEEVDFGEPVLGLKFGERLKREKKAEDKPKGLVQVILIDETKVPRVFNIDNATIAEVVAHLKGTFDESLPDDILRPPF